MAAPSHIRPALPIDRPTLERIVREAYAPFAVVIGKPPGPVFDDYGKLIAEGRVHVLEQGGDVLGLVVLIPEADALLLDNVAVSPIAHGRGLGKQLMLFAEEFAKVQGFGAIKLYTNELMTDNLAIYAKLGYRETHRAAEKGYNRVYMRKDLR